MPLFTQAMLYRLLTVFVVIGTIAAIVPLPGLTDSAGARQTTLAQQAFAIGLKAKLK